MTTAAQAIATGRAKATCPTMGKTTCWLWLNVLAASGASRIGVWAS